MRAFPELSRSNSRFLRTLSVGVVSAVLLFLSTPAPVAADGDDIARDLANPFSSLWSIVNQFNFNQLKGGWFEKSHTQFNWNLQPVMPVPFNSQFNIVNRPVIPFFNNPYLGLPSDIPLGADLSDFRRDIELVRQLAPAADIQYASGIGDMQLASLLVPNKADGIIWGLGITMIAPTSSNSKQIGQGVWQFGPAAGLFYVSKQFVAGVFPQHWHAVSGVDNDHPSTRFTNIQYAVSYLPTPELTIFTSNNILADWTKDEANRWTVPVGMGISYLFHFGKQPISIGINYQWIVKHPADFPHQESIVRLTFTPVIPSPFAKKE